MCSLDIVRPPGRGETKETVTTNDGWMCRQDPSMTQPETACGKRHYSTLAARTIALRPTDHRASIYMAHPPRSAAASESVLPVDSFSFLPSGANNG